MRLLKRSLVCILILSSQVLMQPSYAALTCDASNQLSLDWDDVGRDWPDPVNGSNNPGDYSPTLNHAESVGGVNFDFTFSSDASNAVFINSIENRADIGLGTPDDISQSVGPGDLDGDGANDQGLGMVIIPDSDLGTGTAPIDIDVFLDATLSEPISQFEFTVSDVDESTNAPARRDQVTVIGYIGGIGGTQVLPVASHLAGAANPTTTLTGNIATTTVGAGGRTLTNNPEEAIVQFTFSQQIDSFRVIYSDAVETGGDIGGRRGITMMNDFAFCPAPDLSITKTDNQANYTPGEPFSYDIVVTNNGSGSANGAIFSDNLPAWAQPTPPATVVEWSCVASGGAVCPATVTGSGDVIPTLLVGGIVTFTVSGTYSPNMVDYP